jgi:hypothetical protein
LRYVQEGNRVEYDTGPGSVRQVGEFRMVQNYLSVPLLLQFRPPRMGGFFLSLGPEVAFLLSGRLIVEQTIDIGSGPVPNTEYDDIHRDLEPTNLSLDAGLGVEVPMENHVGVVQLRYSHGLTGVADPDEWFSDWKTQGIEWLAGMRW